MQNVIFMIFRSLSNESQKQLIDYLREILRSPQLETIFREECDV